MKEMIDNAVSCHTPSTNTCNGIPDDNTYGLGSKVFQRTPKDNKIGMSIEDGTFPDIRDRNVYLDDSNS